MKYINVLKSVILVGLFSRLAREARVTYNSHVEDISGKLGNVVHVKGQIMRKHVIPANPRSEGQQTARSYMSAVQGGVKRTGTATRDAVKASLGFIESPYGLNQWHVYLGNKVRGASNTEFAATLGEFDAFIAADKAAWDAAATTANFALVDLPNLTTTISPGAQMYALAKGLFNEGVHVAEGVPVGTNSAGWGAAIVS